MKKIIIIGRPNVGKSLFMVNFAEYLGLKIIALILQYPDGKILKKEMSIDIARKKLSSEKPHETKCLQSTDFKVTVHKGKKEFKFVDTCGLSDGIHPSLAVREGIAFTLQNIINCDLLVHMVDVSLYNNDNIYIMSEIDRQILTYGIAKGKYVMLANKIDLDFIGKGISYLKENFKDIYIIPISALYKTGFNEVKAFVLNSI